jgi:4-amino-4-deoxy-L-arabinose transferase-like glycosyltransferase
MLFKKIEKAEVTRPRSRIPRKHLSRRARALEKFIVEEIEIGDVHSPVTTPPVQNKIPLKSTAWWVGMKVMGTCLGLWLLLIAASLFARSIWPVDETRVLGVAWEMWTRNEIVLPSLNGELIARHPPLMMWLIHIGWTFLGINDWWPRLLPALFALASFFVIGRLARLLWRENLAVGRYAPLVLMGMPLWAIYITLALPDMLLVFFTLLGWWAVLIMWRHRDMRAFLLLGTALGLGALAHGMTVYLYVLPVALLAPLWIKGNTPIVWKYWYIDIGKAALLGLVLLSIWLVPAALQGGLNYALTWFTESLVSARLDWLSSAQSWWWYLAWLPIIFLPWSIWPLLWTRLWHTRREPLSVGMTFCLTVGFSTLLVLSLIEVKQPQFLLPLLPIAALMISHLLMDDSVADIGQDHPLNGMTLPIVVLGGMLAVLPRLPRVEFLPEALWTLSPFFGVGIVIAGIALAWIPVHEFHRRVQDMVIASALLVVFGILGLGLRYDAIFRIEEGTRLLASAQAQQRPTAHVGDYAGELQFSGRLSAPLQVIEPAAADYWLMTHPDGLLVAYDHVWQSTGRDTMRPVFESPYRGHTLRIWRVDMPAPPMPQP